MLSLNPSLTQLDREEFCLARGLKRGGGRPRSKDSASSKPLITERRFTSLLPEVVIWHDTCALFDSSVFERKNDLALAFFAAGGKG